MKRANRAVLSLTIMAGACFAQSPPKKAHMLHGNGEKVEGWMAAMNMDFKIGDARILNKLKSGDQISATTYDGDDSLHRVALYRRPIRSPSNK
jgi:hypothetical protein